MSDHTKLFERAAARYEPPELPMDGLLKRRDRKRRNQRIAAGVVGIAVFVAAIWIVTSGGSFDRTRDGGSGRIRGDRTSSDRDRRYNGSYIDAGAGHQEGHRFRRVIH